MNKRLTEIMDEMQEELLEVSQDKVIDEKQEGLVQGIEEKINQETIGDIENRQMAEVSLSRIKTLALEGIKKENDMSEKENSNSDNPDYNKYNEATIETNVEENQDKDVINLEEYKDEAQPVGEMKWKSQQGATRKYKKSIVKRILVPLVAVMALAVGSIAAIHYNPTLNSIFGEFFPFKDQVQSISKSMSANGLTFTAEGAFIDSKSGIFVVSFTKEDGTAFEEGTGIREMRHVTQKPGAMGWGTQSQLSSDRKQLNCIVDLSGSNQLSAQKLTLEASDINAWRDLTAKSEVALEKLTPKDIHMPWKENKSVDGLKLNLAKEFKEVSLDAFNISDKGIELITSYYDQENIEDQYISLQIIDTRTQKVYEPSRKEHYWSNEEALNKDYYVFNQFSKGDLPYLKVNVKNSYSEKLLEGNWQVDFELNKNGQIKTKRIYQVIQNDKQKLMITKVEVSAIGVTLEGYRWSRKIEALQDFYLIMKDGTKLELGGMGSNSAGIRFNMYYKVASVEENEGSILGSFIDIDKVKSIVIEGKETYLQ